MSLHILRGFKRLIQYLNDLLRLCILELIAKFIVHSYPHHTIHDRSVIKPLHVSVSCGMRSVGSRFFRCLIRKDVQNLLMLQDDLELSILAIKIRSDKLVAIQQHMEEQCVGYN